MFKQHKEHKYDVKSLTTQQLEEDLKLVIQKTQREAILAELSLRK